MPRPALKFNHNLIKLPKDIRTKLIAALDMVQARSSKGVKRKRDNDDDDVLTNFRRLLAHDDDEDDDSDEDENDENGDDDTSWINRWVDKPFGEGGRKNKGRPGWGKPEILKTAGITEAKYNHYMKSAHRLCGRYFDTRMTFSDNYALSPAEYGLIVEANHTCTSPFTDNEEMKELHPRFRFHTHDWLIRHLLVQHCQATARSFAKIGDDPDLKIYENCMNNQKREKQKKAQQALKKRHVEPQIKIVICSVLPSL